MEYSCISGMFGHSGARQNRVRPERLRDFFIIYWFRLLMSTDSGIIFCTDFRKCRKKRKKLPAFQYFLKIGKAAPERAGFFGSPRLCPFFRRKTEKPGCAAARYTPIFDSILPASGVGNPEPTPKAAVFAVCLSGRGLTPPGRRYAPARRSR